MAPCPAMNRSSRPVTGLRRSLGVLPLVFVMYFNVSGGAFSLHPEMGLPAIAGALAAAALGPLFYLAARRTTRT